MEYLFTYGTLQDKQVQQYLFGRILDGKADFLKGYQRHENAVYGRYPLVEETRDPEHRVAGTAYKVSPSDLAKADVYETSAYKRQKVILDSGLEAWLYVKNSD